MRSTGVIQPDQRSCIPSCIATFLGHTELKNPLQKVGRDGNLAESDNGLLARDGARVARLPGLAIPASGSCLVLGVHVPTQQGHCFLFTDRTCDWDPAPRGTGWTSEWRALEVWSIERIPPSQADPSALPTT
jgi:hypothetical protein